MTGEKYLLVKGTAGLGNRLESLLTAMLYARLSDRRLLIDWTDDFYATGGINVFPLYFQCPLYDPGLAIPDTLSVSPPIWRGNLHASAYEMRQRYLGDARGRGIWRQFSIDLERLDQDEELAVIWLYAEQVDLLRRHFVGPFAGFAEADSATILRRAIRENLSLQPHLRQRVAEFERAAFRRPTVGVHVRYTDYRAGLGAILWRLARLLRREPGLQVFLATDNQRIKRLFETVFPSVISTPHWYPAWTGRPLHKGSRRPDPIERGAEALVDLYLLAACDYLIVDRGSSFGHVAALLSEAPAANVFNVPSLGKPPTPVLRWSYRLWLYTGMYHWVLGGFAGLWWLMGRMRPSGPAGALPEPRSRPMEAQEP